MQFTVSNQKCFIDVELLEIDNHALALSCVESFRFKKGEVVLVSSKYDESISVEGEILASNDGHLYVTISENALNRLQLAERRKFTRYPLAEPIPCTILEKQSYGNVERYQGQILDISIEGLKVSSDFALKQKIAYEVVVSEQDPRLGGFQCGIQIKNLRSEIDYDDKIYGSTIEQMNVESQVALDQLIKNLQEKTINRPSLFHKLRALIS